MWQGYSQCWEDFHSRLDNDVKLVEYCKENANALQLEKCHHILSVGPGTGTVDIGLISLMPNLVKYTGLEPDVDNVRALADNLSKCSQVQTEYMKKTLQDYDGVVGGYDAILMIHVVYYFADSLIEQIRRTLSWLTEKGKLIIIIDYDYIHSALEKKFDLDFGEKLIRANDVNEQLDRHDISFKEYIVEYSLDISEPGKGYYDFIGVILNRQPTREEAVEALRQLEPLLRPGSKKLKCKQGVFVIEKQ